MPDINPILDAIDGAIDGYTSADSMRWVPPEDLAEAMADDGACRLMITRSCPSHWGSCGDRPCARYESDDPTPWLRPEDPPTVGRRQMIAQPGEPADWVGWVELGAAEYGLSLIYEEFDGIATWEEVWRRASLYMDQMVFGPSQPPTEWAAEPDLVVVDWAEVRGQHEVHRVRLDWGEYRLRCELTPANIPAQLRRDTHGQPRHRYPRQGR